MGYSIVGNDIFVSALLGMFSGGFFLVALFAGIGLFVAVIKKARRTGGWTKVFIYLIQFAVPVVLLLGVYLVSEAVPFRAAFFWLGTLFVPLFLSIICVVHPKIRSFSGTSRNFVIAIKAELKRNSGS